MKWYKMVWEFKNWDISEDLLSIQLVENIRDINTKLKKILTNSKIKFFKDITCDARSFRYEMLRFVIEKSDINWLIKLKKKLVKLKVNKEYLPTFKKIEICEKCKQEI